MDFERDFRQWNRLQVDLLCLLTYEGEVPAIQVQQRMCALGYRRSDVALMFCHGIGRGYFALTGKNVLVPSPDIAWLALTAAVEEADSLGVEGVPVDAGDVV